jgi:hypothetical protein
MHRRNASSHVLARQAGNASAEVESRHAAMTAVVLVAKANAQVEAAEKPAHHAVDAA